MVIRSKRQAEQFRDVAIYTGSPRLRPIVRLIARIIVRHLLYNDSQSWHHILCALIPQVQRRKLHALDIIGPPPPSFAPRKLRSPHWSIPTPVASPPAFTPYREVQLYNVSFASLSDIVLLLRQLRRVQSVRAFGLTWSKSEGSQGALRPAVLPQSQRLAQITITDCQDGPMLISWLLRFGPHPDLSRLSSDGEAARALLGGVVALATQRRTREDRSAVWYTCSLNKGEFRTMSEVSDDSHTHCRRHICQGLSNTNSCFVRIRGC